MIEMHRGTVEYDSTGHATGGYQYAVHMPDGRYLVYGDQSWVANGSATADFGEGHVVRRAVTITYGPWEEEL